MRTPRRMIPKPIWIGSNMVACAGEMTLYTQTGQQVCRNRQRLHHGLFDLIPVSHFHSHRLVWFSHHLSTGYLALFFEPGALHRQWWCCLGSITRSREQAIIILVDKISYGKSISGLLLHCRRTLGNERHQYVIACCDRLGSDPMAYGG